MASYIHSSNVFALARDKDSEGSLWLDSNNEVRLDWKLGEFDSNTLTQGIEVAAKILLAAGAREVWANQSSFLENFKRDPLISSDDVLSSFAFNEYIAKVKKVGITQEGTELFSAHQMGSCRMSSSPKQGAVDPRGRMYGVKNVYVSDGSVFPTASGVNPMITIYSVAYSIAQCLKEDMADKGKV
jgi:choline dehydrogenase-like flavoprotein